ncbi:uncharacterized protein Triagg1_10640 [Trichoderma aggressivum f. europaeum]|uniref:Uncharacterized protein n=1 Tax=Trichoderma aggressivum f. europaeum TaxID=173218 RepID=A0AAE1I544_9HYPO|nr:hypothetical protein Triagg1_10640 [Trichoderma aggressivum f. europaeum]
MRHAFAQAKSSPFGRTMTTAGFFVASGWGYAGLRNFIAGRVRSIDDCDPHGVGSTAQLKLGGWLARKGPGTGAASPLQYNPVQALTALAIRRLEPCSQRIEAALSHAMPKESEWKDPAQPEERRRG